MYLPDDFRSWCLSLLSNQTLQQLAPFLVLLLVPLLVLNLTSQGDHNSVFWSIAMVLENVGLGFHWWGSSSQSTGSGEKRKSRKKHSHGRTRTGRGTTGNGSAKHGEYSRFRPQVSNNIAQTREKMKRVTKDITRVS